MAILLDRQSRVIVQGITGRLGSFHAKLMMEYGTSVVGGVTPGKGGDWFDGVPVFDTVKMAVEVTEANVSLITVPAPYAADAIFEAINAGITLIICLTEHIPIADMMKVHHYLKRSPSRLIGPNCPGILTPDQAKVGIIPGDIAMPGNVGIVSRSGTLMYEVIQAMSRVRIGQSTCVGIGGDPIVGTSFTEVLEMFEFDPYTEKIVLIGEIGGTSEIDATSFIKTRMTKPIVAYIAGLSAPRERRMGHAGAIIVHEDETAAAKIEVLRDVGARIANTPDDISKLLL